MLGAIASEECRFYRTATIFFTANINYQRLTSCDIAVKTTGMVIQSTQIQMRGVKVLDGMNSPFLSGNKMANGVNTDIAYVPFQ